MKIFVLIYFVVIALCVSLSSCKRKDFEIGGNVSNAAGLTMVLERQDPLTGWQPLDSLVLTGKGDFRFASPRPEHPELYRLSLNGKYLYLPVDSTETLLLRSDGKNFPAGFTLSGTPQAEAFTCFEREAARIEATGSRDSLDAFKRRVYTQYLRDARGNILSYYILSRPMGSMGYLIDYTDPLYAAVATSFETYRPDDPHTALLAERAKQGAKDRRKAAGRTRTMQAEQTGVVPVSLPGIDGEVKHLTSMLGKGKPVVVAFVAQTAEKTPAVNRTLRNLYDAGRCDVYEICLDSDQFAWRQASASLPWTVVIDPDGAKSQAALRYNVGSLPVFFIYDSRGDLADRTTDPSKIASLLK